MPFATTTRSSTRGRFINPVTAQRPNMLRDTRVFAQLSHFLYMFHPSLKLEAPDFVQLENELEQSKRGPLVTDIIKRSLQLLNGNRRMEDDKLESYMSRVWIKHAGGFPEEYEQGWETLGAGDRTRMMLETCELVLCRPETVRVGEVGAMGAEELRVEPIGKDDLGRAYWLLCGNRLYRETPQLTADLLIGEDLETKKEEPKKRRSARLVNTPAAPSLPKISAETLEFADPPRHTMREIDGDLWELLCDNSEEWNNISKLFIRSRSTLERRLHTTLSDISPKAIRHYNAIQRKQNIIESMSIRKRSTRIALRESLETNTLESSQNNNAETPHIDKQHRNQRAKRREETKRTRLQNSMNSLDVLQSESDWMFTCSCGKSGLNYDDGRAMTACEDCGVWRHLGCALRMEAARIGRDIDEDDWENIRYICPECRKAP